MTCIEKIKKEIENELSLCESNNLYDDGRRCALNHIKLFVSCMQECNDEDEIRSDWRPSREQLEALWDIIPHLPNCEEDFDKITKLSLLYDDLKKLCDYE